MKKPLLLLPCLFILFVNTNCLAQYPGMGAVYRQMNNQFMNQQMNMMMRLNMNTLWKTQGSTDRVYDFLARLKDGTKLTLKSKIYGDTSLKKSYVVMEDKAFPKKDEKRFRKIYVNETAKLNSVTEYDHPMGGIPTDSCWLFRTIEGPLSLYAYLPEYYEEYYPGLAAGLQVGNGKIVEYSDETLMNIIINDGEALALFGDKKYYKAILKYNKNILKAAKK